MNGDYDKRCDLWSLGVITYMLLCGAPPFWGGSDREILKRVKSLPVGFPSELFRGVSLDAKAFVLGLLERDVEKRFTAEDAAQHPFLAGADSVASVGQEFIQGLNDSFEDIWESVAGPPPPSALAESLRNFSKLNAFTKLVVEVAASQLGPDEILKLRDDFLDADADGNGVLSLTELAGALGSSVGPEEVQKLFDAVDVDSSNEIGFHEFVAAALTRRVDLDDRALHAAFDAIDSEGLGYITPEAVRATMGVDFKNYKDDDVDAALAAADSDHDGRIDYAEFLDYVKKSRLAVVQTAEPAPSRVAP